jgi:hypothetical protein
VKPGVAGETLQRHVSLLAVLTALEGGLSVLVGVSTLILAVGALTELSGPSSAPGLTMAAGVTALAFGIFAACALAWGGAHLWAASLLNRRRAAGRAAMLALGVCNLPLVPFGSVLGVYALWVLGSSTARPFFTTPLGPTGP